jgi:hypothetical protein
VPVSIATKIGPMVYDIADAACLSVVNVAERVISIKVVHCVHQQTSSVPCWAG